MSLFPWKRLHYRTSIRSLLPNRGEVGWVPVSAPMPVFWPRCRRVSVPGLPLLLQQAGRVPNLLPILALHSPIQPYFTPKSNTGVRPSPPLAPPALGPLTNLAIKAMQSIQSERELPQRFFLFPNFAGALNKELSSGAGFAVSPARDIPSIHLVLLDPTATASQTSLTSTVDSTLFHKVCKQ